MSLPRDPVMLLSVVNTYLRDAFDDLDELCASLSVSRDELEERLAAAGYRYQKENNRFQ